MKLEQAIESHTPERGTEHYLVAWSDKHQKWTMDGAHSDPQGAVKALAILNGLRPIVGGYSRAMLLTLSELPAVDSAELDVNQEAIDACNSMVPKC